MSDLMVAAMIGSLRAASLNRRLYEHARTLAPDGMQIEEAPIRDLPLYDEDLRDGGSFPEPVAVLRRRLAAADALLIVSPEYNFSIPAPLKNAIDWCSRGDDQPFAGKAVAIMGASPGRLGTGRMQYHLRQVFVFVDAYPLNKPEVMVAGAASQFGEGETPDEATSSIVASQLEALAAWTRRLA